MFRNNTSTRSCLTTNTTNRDSPKLGPQSVYPKVTNIWPKIDWHLTVINLRFNKIEQHFTEFDQHFTEIEDMWPIFNRNWPTFDQNLPKIDRNWPKIGWDWPTFVRKLIEIDQQLTPFSPIPKAATPKWLSPNRWHQKIGSYPTVGTTKMGSF